MNTRSRKVFAALAAGSALLAAAGCSSSASASKSPVGTVQFWTLQDPTNTVQQAAVDAFNATGQGKVSMSVIATDGFKDKVRTGMGSSQMPGIFFIYGGGSLDDYVKAGKLVTLDSALKAQFLPAALQAGTVDGKLVGIPARGTQPVFLFYNKKVFADAGVQPPKTWSDLTNLVQVFKGRGVTPFTVAGSGTSSWTELMWIEYLVDRLAGPQLFQKIEGGTGDPADVVGNPTNYLSVTTAAPQTTAAAFLKTTYSDSYVEGLVAKGEVPVTANAKQALAKAPDPAYAEFQYDLVSNAPAFTQSWDQALGLTLGTPLLTEIQKLFNGQDSPQQFVSGVLAIKH